ncbi:MAG: biotin/lipoate A/B protein ligase family protein [Candidatus Kapaibacteriota bacterium]
MKISGKRISELINYDVEVIFDGAQTGTYNMQFDYQRAILHEEGKSLPMLRFYAWNPWAISLGANQKETDFDRESLKKYGFDLVKRPTGGRAVLHANELTYCFVGPISQNITAKDIYREIHFFLVQGLRQLGAKDLEFEKSQPNFNEFYKREAVSISCFASSARYEIEWKGKKIVGSAQRIIGNTVLQHGSVLLGTGYELIAEVANLKDENSRELLRNFIKNHSISMEEILGRKISYNQAIEVFKNLLLC